MAFEKFEASGRGGQGSTIPKISLRKSASLGVNNSALDSFFEEDDEAVIMYYDDEAGQIGLNPVKNQEKAGAYTLTRSESGGSVSPGAFLRSHNLVPDRTMQFSPSEASLEDDLELIVFEIGENSEDFIGFYGNTDE